MENTISTATPGTDAAANPATGTAQAANGNGQPNGEATGQGATGSDSFIPQGIDLNTLPPQVRAYVEEVNKQMVRGFTEKTTKLSDTVKSETAKAVEAYRQKAEFYDAFVQQEELVKYYNDYLNRSKATGQQNQDDPIKQEIQAIKTELETSKANQVIDAFRDAVDEKGTKLNPDFDELDGYVVGEPAGKNGGKDTYSLLRACVELAPGSTPQEKLANGYKAAKALKESIFEAGRKAQDGKMRERAKNGTFAPSSVNAGSMAPRRPKDGLEALQFARQGLTPNKE